MIVGCGNTVWVRATFTGGDLERALSLQPWTESGDDELHLQMRWPWVLRAEERLILIRTHHCDGDDEGSVHGKTLWGEGN